MRSCLITYEKGTFQSDIKFSSRNSRTNWLLICIKAFLKTNDIFYSPFSDISTLKDILIVVIPVISARYIWFKKSRIFKNNDLICSNIAYLTYLKRISVLDQFLLNFEQVDLEMRITISRAGDFLLSSAIPVTTRNF